jgi:hypothetical protein
MGADSILFAGALSVAGPLMSVQGFRVWRRRRLIQDTPAARIRSMAMGLVEVNGRVSGRSSVTAPFSGHECVYWQVDISVPGRRGSSWTVVHHNACGQPFYLEDDTGAALVYPAGGDCTLPHGVEEIVQPFNVPDCYASYLKEHAPLLRMSTLRFRERVLQEGQNLFVLGTATPRAHEVTISDGEALATGTDGPHALQIAQLRQRDAAVRGVIRQGTRERTFVLSPESAKQITFELGLKSGLLMLAGPAATAVGLWMWFEMWGRSGPHR